MTAEQLADLQVRLRPEQRQVPAVTLQRSFCKNQGRSFPGRMLKNTYACLFVDLHFECGYSRSFDVAAAGRLELDR